MVKRIIYILVLGGLSFITSGCYEDAVGGVKVKPTALGRMNEIVVIADEDMWESPVRDTFKFYFESAYPIMPRPEPMFDLRHFTPNEILTEPLRQELRTYAVLANLSESDSRAVEMIRTDLGEERYRRALNGEISSIVVKDKWARGQILIYLMGRTRAELFQTIRKNYPALARRVNLHDEEQLRSSIYVRGNNPGLNNRIKDRFGIELNIPILYKEARDLPEDNVLWIRKDDEESTMNILITQIPYENQTQFETDNMIELYNEYGRYVLSSEPTSVLVVNDEDLPIYTYNYEIDGQFTKEMRGIWEMTDDYIGGAFAAYLIMLPSEEKLIFINTFVYAPGKEKRDMMQQLEYLVKSATFPDSPIKG